MTPPLPSLRYEKKFIAQGFTLPDVIARIRRHPSAFREVYPPRIVNNIYLDSPARRDYHDHVNGAANRSKTRLRWYGEQFDAAQRPMLERKMKCGMVSGKETHPLPPLSMNGGSLRSLLDTVFDSAGLPQPLRSALRHTEPALLNRYRRHYFLSHDGAFRLTLDFNLQFAPPPNGRPPALPQPQAPAVIIELKFAPELAHHADAITNAFPFRLRPLF